MSETSIRELSYMTIIDDVRDFGPTMQGLNPSRTDLVQSFSIRYNSVFSLKIGTVVDLFHR